MSRGGICRTPAEVDLTLWRASQGLPADADWLAEAELPNASITEVEHWPHGRRDDGAPVFSLIRRIGNVGHLPPGVVTEI